MVRTTALPSGAFRHELAVSPAALPAVPPAALEVAWECAREAAEAGLWGPARLIAFQGGEEIALTDPDAAAWAEAMERHAGFDTLAGLALCLRLLALVEVMGRAAWLRGHFAIGAHGVEFHPVLLAAAARAPLDATGRFEESAMRAMMKGILPRAASPA
jgi:hypothetical protein